MTSCRAYYVALAMLLAAVALVLPPASGLAQSGGETRVGASAVLSTARAGDFTPLAAVSQLGQAHPYDKSASGSLLAAEGGAELTGTALARSLGREGGSLIPGAGNKVRIALPNGGYRITDILDESGGVLGEVKNVKSLSYSAQLRDYAVYSQANGMQFDLYVRGSTTLSGPLQGAVDNGLINLFRRLPG